MIDIGYSGAWFTWSNHHPLNHLIQERIDWVFINAEWNFLYPDASVQHLKRAHSDHCPILLCLDENHDVKLPQPFRFQPIWLSHPTFPSIVREAWSGPIVLSSVVANFADKAKIWNKNIFGNLFQWKKRLLARLLGIQVALSIRPNRFLLELERQLRLEFHDISKIEEGFGPMKSRITWLVEGDRSTRFYHTLALVRRRRNHISCLKDQVGNWIQGDREIAEFIRNGYAELFSSSHTYSILSNWNLPC